MRVSCNGCRVLRKGCSDNCTIRPCLQWIKSPESQANATVFLAKFYGRAGLQNLINAGPDHHRPAIFRSLLYEACGRIVNPIYGSAGLLWSGNWNLCHAAVEAVLSGKPIVQVSPESAASNMSPPLKACDIRHVASRDLHRERSQKRFKRAADGAKLKVELELEPSVDEAAAEVMWSWSNKKVIDRSASHESVMSHEPEKGESGGDSASVETVEEQLRADGSNVELELTLGLEPAVKEERVQGSMMRSEEEIEGVEEATCVIQLALNCSA